LWFLWLCTFLLRFAAGLVLRGPNVFGDEFDYWDMARSFVRVGHFQLYHLPAPYPTVLYPLFISPAFLLHNPKAEMIVVKIISALLMSSSIFVVYGLAREFVAERAALLACLVIALNPSGIYASQVLTENLFLPVAVLSVWACYLTLAEGCLLCATMAGLVLCLGFYVKIQEMFFAVAYAVPVIVWSLSELIFSKRNRDWNSILRGTIIRALPGVIFLAMIAVRWSMGARYHYAFGPSVFGEGYSDLSQFAGKLNLKWYFCSALGLFEVLSLSTLFVPMAALVCPVGAWRECPRNLKMLWWLTVSSAAMYIIMVARHNALHDELLRVHERYVFVLTPLIWIWFLAIHTKLRMRVMYALALAMAALCSWSLVMVRPANILSWNTLSDSGTFSLFFYLRQQWAAPLAILAVLVLIAVLAFLGVRYLRNSIKVAKAALVWGMALVLLNIGWYLSERQWGEQPVRTERRTALDLRRRIPQDSNVAMIYNRFQQLGDLRTEYSTLFWLENPITIYAQGTHGPLYGWEKPMPLREGRPDFHQLDQKYVVWVGEGSPDLLLIKKWDFPKVALYCNGQLGDCSVQ
jgi:hypothetical protein